MAMRITALFILLTLCRFLSAGSDTLYYQLAYQPGATRVQVEIRLPSPSGGPQTLVIPRSAPGTYSMTTYDVFVSDVLGITAGGDTVRTEKGEGSYFDFDPGQDRLSSIRYAVDIERMEQTLLSASESSKVRKGYLGLLGYSVFGLIKGREEHPIRLDIRTEAGWPVYATVAPAFPTPTGKGSYSISGFAELADGQYLLGPGLQVWKAPESPIPFFVALYSETRVDIAEIGRQGLIALKGLEEYFGFIPMPHYTMCMEFLIPKSPDHDYGFSMEHLNSMTSYRDTSAAIREYQPNPRLNSIAHHIGHSWIPLRCYGEGYRPFEWETAPLIETIWLNEGFTWYISIYKVLGVTPILDYFRSTLENAPDFIRKKSLKDLSLLGSTQYGSDFRIGQNLFSRGALLAYDLDLYISEKTNGKRSFRDGVLALFHWSAQHQRAFRFDEIPLILSEGTGVDIAPVWRKWTD